MLAYTARRIMIMVPTLLAISVIIFVIIQLPPGDYLETYISELQAQGEAVDPARIEFLRKQYGLDRPLHEQYLLWLAGLLQGDYGYSFEYQLPVSEVVGDRLYLTMLVSFATVIFTWSFGKFISILEHLWVPVIVIGTSGTAAMIRRLRANLLDELQKQYVTTARAKGMHPGRLLIKYPLRIALNPFIADIGNLLPQIVSGAAIVAIVLGLPTTGPMLIRALQSQDMYLAGSFLMFLSLLTVIGMFLSDLALAALDPRIRLEGGATK
jgi:peptide/nickel transport system permease protein